MECWKFNKAIGEYYDHCLSEDRREVFEKHLAECVTCQKTLSEWAEVSAMTKAIPAVKAPENFEVALRQRMREDAPRLRGWEAFWYHLAVHKLPLAALAAMVIVLISALLIRSNQAPGPLDSAAVTQQDPLYTPEYVDVLLKGRDNEPVILRLPSTLRVDSPDNDESYFQNVSH